MLTDFNFDQMDKDNVVLLLNNAINNNSRDISLRIDNVNNFADDIWDFNYDNKNKRSLGSYKINFCNIPECFKYYCKVLILKEIKIKKIRISSCTTINKVLKNLCNSFYKLGVIDARLFTVEIVKSYFKNISNNSKPTVVAKRASALNKFIKIIESIEKIDFSMITEYLNEVISKYSKIRPFTAVNDYIPDIFLNQLVSLAMADIDNKELSYPTRLVSALIVILANTGMRAEELSLLERNKLRTIEFNNKKVNFLDFLTFKTVGRNKDSRETSCFLTEEGTIAYRKAENLVDEYIDNLSSTIKNKVLYYFYSGTYIEGKKKLPIKYVEELNSLSQVEKDKLISEAKRYLYLGKYGLLIRGTSQLRNSVKKFFIRHRNDIDLSKLTSKEKEQIRYYDINTRSIYEYYFNVDERKNLTFEEARKMKIPYVGLHQFRVTVCTKLFMQGVHIDYIVKHMNHLSEDMTAYYNKSEIFIDELKESIKLINDITNDKGMLETDFGKINGAFIEEANKDELLEKIKRVNEFLNKNNLNINKDISKITKLLLKTNTTIEENDFGMCIRSIINGICEKKRYFSSLEDNYYIGVQLDTYKFLNNHYKRFKQKRNVVLHNKQMSEKKSQYINEYNREKKALSYYVKKTVSKEIELLEDDIEEFGIDNIINRYPDLRDIVYNLEEIKGELKLWV